MNLWPTSWSLWSSSSSSPKATLLPPPVAPAPIVNVVPTPDPQVSTDHRDPSFTPFQRTRKQLTMYFAGATFLLLSMSVARRSTRRRYLATVPKYYTPNTKASELNFNGGVDAFEALNIASLGVMSVGMMSVGASMYLLDVVNVDEMRRLFRSRYGLEGRKSEMDVEEELEEWVASVLARKEQKEKARGGN
ncbi:hypothetical protein H072_8907 [Dactylellina haptotyla CBS 200.50]|uniref:Altered inheritance of mitochondria protein 11 n=1 Tax=Dactylellina haptotyla (strain CBS 200.50) TaxID=1284197 RepID=S8BDY8_DACHA|nr:hypothetical protein H072_8907 [Dactylellina haptotyla CBS 200.50]